jgi:hypothetical protein
MLLCCFFGVIGYVFEVGFLPLKYSSFTSPSIAWNIFTPFVCVVFNFVS